MQAEGRAAACDERFHAFADAVERHFTGQEGREEAEEAAAGLEVYGRWTSDREPGKLPEALSSTKGRRSVFLFGPDACTSLLTRLPAYEILLHLGFSPFHIHHEVVVAQESQRLLLLSPSAVTTYPATWEGVLAMVEAEYEAAREDARRWWPRIASQPVNVFEEEQREWERQQGVAVTEDGFFGQFRGHLSNPRFLSYAKYCEIDPKERQPWHLRLFLYCEMRLNENFNGDGRTKHPDGSPGVAEFLARNQPLLDDEKRVRPGIRIINIPEVTLPDEVLREFGFKS